ncbi:MAG: hypothetical protein OXN17_22265 [Candidatus Poribacteria bacterium]|nr:hypothetical protein [Candidatus Poribacteria bacterium]
MTHLGVGGRYNYYRFGHAMSLCTTRRIFFSVAVLGLLLWALNQLLSQAKLADTLGTTLMSELLLVLIASPYFSSRALANKFSDVSPDNLIVLSRINPRCSLGAVAVRSQVLLICFVILTTPAFVLIEESSGGVSLVKLLSYYLVLLASVFSGARIGMLGWRIFRHEIHAVQFAYAISLLMIGGVFLLSPLNRFFGSLLIAGKYSIVPVFLLINPLIAVCQLFDVDIFRAPHLYNLTPLPSSVFYYPKWYAVCGFQVLLGLCCFFMVSRLNLFKDFHRDKA